MSKVKSGVGQEAIYDAKNLGTPKILLLGHSTCLPCLELPF